MKSVKNFFLNTVIQMSAGKIEKKQLTESEILTNNEDQFIGQSYSTKKSFGLPKFKKDSNVQYKKF